MRKWFLLFVIFALFFCISSCFAEDVNNTDCFEINSSEFNDEPLLEPDLRIIAYNTSIESYDKFSYYGGSCNFNVYLLDDYNDYLPGYTLYSYADGNLYNHTTDSNGGVVFNFNNLSLGDHIVYSYFEGDENYNSSCAVNFITVNTTIITKDLTKVYGNTTQFKAHFINSNGASLTNTNIPFTINNVNYTYATDNNGDVITTFAQDMLV